MDNISSTLPNRGISLWKIVIICVLIGFVLGSYVGYAAFSPMEDDFESVYYTGMSEGETAAKQQAREEFLILMQQEKINTKLIEIRLEQQQQIRNVE